MKPKITKDKANLFQIPLERVIDQEHPLVQLSSGVRIKGVRYPFRKSGTQVSAIEAVIQSACFICIGWLAL